ncbi:MAG: bifunctional 5,10-methylenetetrahydrofolate dehydrogenase/5,10-methenyltetrahydrofolate cyclohydrolase [Candidatus Omnitrophica bacterium]|nr:bifunctional 5,10-methylenetetrahydrofolate dehydrogenase/5,10-methenyltetrahydrofolate cyclohydrolase [Candidatus Omnitrophota bacterium]
MAKVLNSREICNILEQENIERLNNLPNKLSMASVAIGDNYSTKVYRASQKKVADKLGIKYVPINLKETVSFDDFKVEVEKLNNDKKISGIIFNKPFPKGWKDEDVFAQIDEFKDIEGMHPVNLGKFFMGKDDIVSPTVLSIIKLLDISLEKDANKYKGKRITIVGFSSLIGKPLALLLGNKLATVSITHIGTFEKGDLPFFVKNADIVISSVGQPYLIKGEWIKEGAIVIDVGTGEKNGKLTGDIEFETAKSKASFITPVPGGVGRLTTMFLYNNLIISSEIQTSLEQKH